MKELHEQLVSCINYFDNQLHNYQTAEAEKLSHRKERLRKEMADAQQLVDDVELLMRSPLSVSVGGREIIGRCETFFENCIDSSECEADFSYLDFVPAGRLYVKNEHLGYFRLCDAMPEDVELKVKENSIPVVCNRECTLLIQTNRSSCTNAESSLDVQLCDGQGGPVQFSIVNNNNGSYSVICVPSKPGTLQLNVRLFGITVGSSPLEILVAEEAVTPKRMPEPGAASVGSGNGNTSTRRTSGTPAEYLHDGSARKHAAPPVENFRDEEYFVSSPVAAKASPACALPSKQNDSPVPYDVNFEEVRGSMMRMQIRRANNTGQDRVTSPGVGAASSEHSSHPCYANGACLNFEDLSYEPDNEFDSPGLNLQLS